MALLVKNKRLVVKNGRLQLAGGCCCDTAVSCLLGDGPCGTGYNETSPPLLDCNGALTGVLASYRCCEPQFGQLTEGSGARQYHYTLSDQNYESDGSLQRSDIQTSSLTETWNYRRQNGDPCDKANVELRWTVTRRLFSTQGPDAPPLNGIIRVDTLLDNVSDWSISCGDPGVSCEGYEIGLRRGPIYPLSVSVPGCVLTATGDLGQEGRSAYAQYCGGYAQSAWTRSFNPFLSLLVSISDVVTGRCLVAGSGIDAAAGEGGVPGDAPSFRSSRCGSGEAGPLIDAGYAMQFVDAEQTVFRFGTCCYEVDPESSVNEAGVRPSSWSSACGECGVGYYRSIKCCTGEAGPDIPTPSADAMATYGSDVFEYEGGCYRVDRSNRIINAEFSPIVHVPYRDCQECLEANGLPYPDDCDEAGGGGDGGGPADDADTNPTGIAPDQPIGPPIGPGNQARRGTGAFL